MPRQSPLKVFRTTIGFHDAYVAAPSRKAALAAWGAETDLFSANMAEQVTDPALMAEPLAHPGTTIRKARGTLAEHLAAATPVKTPKARKSKPKSTDHEAPRSVRELKTRPAPAPPKPPPPRPSRTALEKAEASLRAFEAQMEAELDQLRDRERQIRDEREALRRKQRESRAQLMARLAKARDRYDDAMRQWQEIISGPSN